MLSKIVNGLFEWGLKAAVVTVVVGIVLGIAKCRVGDLACMWDSIVGVAPLFFIGALIAALVPPMIEEARRQQALEESERRRQQEQEASERRAREAIEARKRRQRQEAAAALQQQKAALASLLASTRRDFLTLPELVPSADMDLDAAERDFDEGVFSPFWDEVEHATNKLAAYDEGIRRVSHNAKDYRNRALKLSASEIPEFSLPDGKLPDARPVAQRLSEIVRKAQKNFEFALIYEQRKTNQLLYAGFGSLGTAIYSLRDKLSQSLSELSQSVNSSLHDLLSATNLQTATIESAAEEQAQLARMSEEAAAARAESFTKLAQELLAKEEEQSRMLDNIQRRRRP